jgi:hypothetical protein
MKGERWVGSHMASSGGTKMTTNTSLPVVSHANPRTNKVELQLKHFLRSMGQCVAVRRVHWEKVQKNARKYM